MSSYLRFAAAIAGVLAAVPHHELPSGPGPKYRKIKLHGTGKKPNNPPGTKKNRSLRRIKGR